MEFNVTAVWHSRTTGKRDGAGNRTTVATDISWPCAYDPGSSAEADDGKTDLTSTSPRLVGQPGNGVPRSGDGFTVPIGSMELKFEVDGDPDVHVSPFPSGRNKIGPVVRLVRTSG